MPAQKICLYKYLVLKWTKRDIIVCSVLKVPKLTEHFHKKIFLNEVLICTISGVREKLGEKNLFKS